MKGPNLTCSSSKNSGAKRPGFFEGVGVALTASLVGASSVGALVAVGAASIAGQLLITVLGFAYLAYLLVRSGQPVGRMTTIAVAGGTTLALGVLAPSLSVQLIGQVLLIWLVRSLYFHTSLLIAGADLALSALSVAGATWALLQTGSVLISVWCLFLVQALHPLLPRSVNSKSGRASCWQQDQEPFFQAQRAAQAAVRRLSLNR